MGLCNASRRLARLAFFGGALAVLGGIVKGLKAELDQGKSICCWKLGLEQCGVSSQRREVGISFSKQMR